ncbi:MAG: redoxin domain-containing protein [Actinomycetota bacterium]|nr:redoxin domain-containing protein [Actinomycetota bacterium]
MRSIIPRPILLVLTLALVVGVISFIELRLDAEPADVQANPQSDRQENSDSITANEDGKPGVEERRDQAASDSAKSLSEDAEDRMSPEEDNPEATADRIARKEAEFSRAEEIVAPSGFINTNDFSINEARGEKVVLLDFWTYTCFNCQNTQPYINRWHEKYADDGLRIVGVHTPEFGFEREYANVEQAVREAGIRYPVVLDNSYATWDAYDQRYWPAWYLIDADGFIRYKHFGEGAYGETEAKIQELLAERNRIGNQARPDIISRRDRRGESSGGEDSGS